jgi:hypothetical protein
MKVAEKDGQIADLKSQLAKAKDALAAANRKAAADKADLEARIAGLRKLLEPLITVMEEQVVEKAGAFIGIYNDYAEATIAMNTAINDIVEFDRRGDLDILRKKDLQIKRDNAAKRQDAAKVGLSNLQREYDEVKGKLDEVRRLCGEDKPAAQAVQSTDRKTPQSRLEGAKENYRAALEKLIEAVEGCRNVRLIVIDLLGHHSRDANGQFKMAKGMLEAAKKTLTEARAEMEAAKTAAPAKPAAPAAKPEPPKPAAPAAGATPPAAKAAAPAKPAATPGTPPAGAKAPPAAKATAAPAKPATGAATPGTPPAAANPPPGTGGALGGRKKPRT